MFSTEVSPTTSCYLLPTYREFDCCSARFRVGYVCICKSDGGPAECVEFHTLRYRAPYAGWTTSTIQEYTVTTRGRRDRRGGVRLSATLVGFAHFRAQPVRVPALGEIFVDAGAVDRLDE